MEERINTSEGEFTISDDPSRVQIDVVHQFLSTSYWAKDIPRETVIRAIENSLSFGVYQGDRQVGFARVITDYTTFAYLADVFIVDAFRGRGLSKSLMAFIMRHPKLQGLRRWMLATRDAHELYRKSGFVSLAAPERFMEIHRPDIYRDANET